MSATMYSAALVGIDAVIVNVEADFSPGQLGRFNIVGLPDTAVQESRERVLAAIKNSGMPFLTKRITVNLAPADIRKQGPVYDLPIAMALMLARGFAIDIPTPVEKTVVIGELALDGAVRPVSGCISIVIGAKERGFEAVIIPAANAAEAALVSGISVYSVECLQDVVTGNVQKVQASDIQQTTRIHQVSMEDVRGHARVKRVLEIAAAGGHNVLLSGPPGSGKTLLAKALPSILPELSSEEMIEVTKIHSVAGLLLREKQLIATRPFRSPHHTSSGVALVGGGAVPRPGEISLAHRGVLFLDEFAEFPRVVLEYLRQPLEDGVITVARAAGSWQFPAEFMLIAAMNPCPCGFVTDPQKECVCSPQQVIKYQQKLSGPLLDRIDLFVEVPRVEYTDLTAAPQGEAAATIRKRVTAARDVQFGRLHEKGLLLNAAMRQNDIETHCGLDAASKKFVEQAITSLGLTARGYFRLLRIARTIADLDTSEYIQKQHLAEALQYRVKIVG